MLPNQDQILSAVRSIVIALTSFAVGKGWISNDVAANIALLVIPLGLAIWGIIDKTKAATVAKAADIVPIDASAQRSAGITAPQLVPTNPKVAT
jgi:hypothetical protein